MINKLATISFVFVVAIILGSCDSTANIEPPYDDYFVKYIGIDGDQDAVDAVTDGDDFIYILASSDYSIMEDGTTSRSNQKEIFVVKTDSRGDVIWQRTYGDTGIEDPRDIEVTASGNLVVLSNHLNTTTGERSFVVYRINPQTGNVIGTPRIDGYNGVVDYANAITETNDGFIVVGYSEAGTQKSAFMIRYDFELARFPNGLWLENYSQTEGTSSFDLIPVKIFQHSANVFYVFCYSNTPADADGIDDYNFYVFVSNQENVSINALLVPGPVAGSNERLTSVSKLPNNNGYILTGYSAEGSSVQNLYAVRMVNNLFDNGSLDIDLLATPREYIPNSTSPVSATDMATGFPSANGGYFMLSTRSTGINDDIFLTRVENDLTTTTWSAPSFYTFGGVGDDAPAAVIEVPGGRVLLCGTMVLGEINGQHKIVLIKLSPEGRFGE